MTAQSKKARPKQERGQTMTERLAAWAMDAEFNRLTPLTVRSLKLHVLDSLACAIGALGADPIRRVRAQVDELGGKPLCTRVGGGKTAPDRAAFYNGALVRYLDFMDNYMGEHQTCHPCDNFAGVLAAAEVAGASGKDFLTSLAVAYQVQSRLCDVAPIQEKGFDHRAADAVGSGGGKVRRARREIQHGIAAEGDRRRGPASRSHPGSRARAAAGAVRPPASSIRAGIVSEMLSSRSVAIRRSAFSSACTRI